MYKIYEEYGSPSYYDYETGKLVQDSCDAFTLGYWVVGVDEEGQAIEWHEFFFPHEIEKAKEYIKELEKEKQQC